MNKVGKKIRLLRHQKGWSQQDVANKLGISIPAFSKMETGITDINLSRLIQIGKLFNLTAVQLLSFSETDQLNDYVDGITSIQQKLKEREEKIIQLQKKVIDLYGQLYKD
ncbi:helix-turn-helix domain-containing protein [Sphingobacterium multivorum]|uniref:Anaerobic benzoate catabolism transcriptional regulator n=1 Tax=Sphingobacterium multivorum TaxID=28454 RepID=A0A2X2L3G9_SPHMU|nr:helix-turn-helix transcriptional regulator [Sphingobacterium multivorum]QRQ61230.1 helix-turn-helix transcriptional regulator [Sphingobacterium multivorum]SPZ88519.1 anaerobic benzoate catabolism transcriptional regulator [Sphingobacterium multivorum]